ncbi:hypothetical protein ACEPAG_9298 [Sanghuangporus baumii]
MGTDEIDAQRNRLADDGPTREAADTFKKQTWEDIDDAAGTTMRRCTNRTSCKRKRTSHEDDDKDSDVPMACARSKDSPSFVTYGSENMSDSRAFQDSAKRSRRYTRDICTVHGPAVAEDCRKILSAPQSRIPRKRSPVRMALAKIAKPIHCFSNPGQLQNVFNDYFLAISRLRKCGLGCRSIGLENLSISVNDLQDGDTEGILTSLDGVDVCLGRKPTEALPSIVSTLPSRLEIRSSGKVPFDGPLQIFQCLARIMTSRHGICNDKCECETHDTSIFDVFNSSNQTWRARLLYTGNFIESVVGCSHPYFDQLKDYLRVLYTPLFSRRIISIQDITHSSASQVDICGDSSTVLRGRYGDWWSEIIFDVAIEFLVAHKKKTRRREEANDTGKAISFDAYEEDRLSGLPTCAMAKESEELDWTRINACLDASSPVAFMRRRNTTLRCVKDKTAQCDSEKRLANVAFATKTMILDAASFSQHFYPQRLPRRKRTPTRVVLAKVTKPVTYFSNPRQLFDAVGNYNISATELQGLELYHRLIGLQSLSITADVKPRKNLFEEPVGILTSLDGVEIGSQERMELQHLPVIVNTLPARLAFPHLDGPWLYFDHRRALRQILECLMWIMTTRCGPYNDECCKRYWSGEKAMMVKSPVYKWHLLASENWNGDDNDIKDTRKKKLEIMTTRKDFEENVIKFIQPYFKGFKAHMRFLRTASCDNLETFGKKVIQSDLTSAFLKNGEDRMWWVNIIASSLCHLCRASVQLYFCPVSARPDWVKMNEYAGFEHPERANIRSSRADPRREDHRNDVSQTLSVKSRDTVIGPMNPSLSSIYCSCAICRYLAFLSQIGRPVNINHNANHIPHDWIQDVVHGGQTIPIPIQFEFCYDGMEREENRDDNVLDRESKDSDV